MDAETFEDRPEREPRADDADGSGDGQRLRDDGVSRRRNVVPAAGGDVGHACHERLVFGEERKLAVHPRRGQRAAPGGVDVQDHSAHLAVVTGHADRRHEVSLDRPARQQSSALRNRAVDVDDTDERSSALDPEPRRTTTAQVDTDADGLDGRHVSGFAGAWSMPGSPVVRGDRRQTGSHFIVEQRAVEEPRVGRFGRTMDPRIDRRLCLCLGKTAPLAQGADQTCVHPVE